MSKKKKEGKILNRKTEKPVDLTVNDQWEVKTLAAESNVKLEDDTGDGVAVTLRHFYFRPNPESFKTKTPTAQELFNSHIKQIEVQLWQDGWKIYSETSPRLMMAKNRSHYVIVVPATPARGQLLTSKPKTLTELISNDTAIHS